MEFRQPYNVEKVKELQKKFTDLIESLPKKTYTYPEIIIGFTSAIFEKAYIDVKLKEGKNNDTKKKML